MKFHSRAARFLSQNLKNRQLNRTFQCIPHTLPYDLDARKSYVGQLASWRRNFSSKNENGDKKPAALPVPPVTPLGNTAASNTSLDGSELNVSHTKDATAVNSKPSSNQELRSMETTGIRDAFSGNIPKAGQPLDKRTRSKEELLIFEKSSSRREPEQQQQPSRTVVTGSAKSYKSMIQMSGMVS